MLASRATHALANYVNRAAGPAASLTSGAGLQQLLLYLGHLCPVLLWVEARVAIESLLGHLEGLALTRALRAALLLHGVFCRLIAMSFAHVSPQLLGLTESALAEFAFNWRALALRLADGLALGGDADGQLDDEAGVGDRGVCRLVSLAWGLFYNFAAFIINWILVWFLGCIFICSRNYLHRSGKALPVTPRLLGVDSGHALGHVVTRGALMGGLACLELLGAKTDFWLLGA